MTSRLRRSFYAIFGLLFVTGAVWLALDRWGLRETEFGVEAHPAQPWILRLHGAAAMAGLVVLGVLLPLHVRRGWKADRNRTNGVILLVFCGVLVASGYLLYYAGSDRLRHGSAVLHDVAGLALPLLILAHVLLGRRTRPPKSVP